MSHPLFEPDFTDVDAASMEAFRAFKRATMLHRRLLMSTFADADMHPAQAACLQAVSHRDGMSQSDLADMLNVSRPTVTAMLQRMEAGGTIERRPDDVDSRVTRVHLTEEGHRAADRMHAAFVGMLDVSVGRLTDEDRHELSRILTTLNDQVEATLKERGVGPWVHPGHGEGAAE